MLRLAIQGYRVSLAKNEAKLVYLELFSAWRGLNPECETSSETQGQLVGRGKVGAVEKNIRRKEVKNEKRSPWGHCFTGSVPNGPSRSGF